MFHQTLYVGNFESALSMRKGKPVGANGQLLGLIGSAEPFRGNIRGGSD